MQNTSETTQSQTYEHTHASTLTRNRATFSDQCFCRTALSIIADLNRRIELSSVRTLVCLCRTFAGAILLWLKTLARRYVLAVVRRQSSKSIILFDFLVGNMSFREGCPVFLLVPPLLNLIGSMLFFSALYGRHLFNFQQTTCTRCLSDRRRVGLHLSGYEGLPQCQAPAHYKRRKLSLPFQ